MAVVWKIAEAVAEPPWPGGASSGGTRWGRNAILRQIMDGAMAAAPEQPPLSRAPRLRHDHGDLAYARKRTASLYHGWK
jgi:hypothetical protein